MNASSVDIKDWLVDNSGLGLVFATNLFIAREPTKPDNCVTIYDTPGEPAKPDFEGDSSIYEDSIQVRIRNTSYITAWDLAEEIRDVLSPVSNTEINETTYLSIFHQNGPFVLEWDDNNRVIVIINFKITRKD
jgi:hypothetical protein